MIQGGWIERRYHDDKPAPDDDCVTVHGVNAAEGYEADFLKAIERRIEEKLG